MKKSILALSVLATVLMASCSTPHASDITNSDNEPVSVVVNNDTLDVKWICTDNAGNGFKMLVPHGAKVMVIPQAITYHEGKHESTTILVK